MKHLATLATTLLLLAAFWVLGSRYQRLWSAPAVDKPNLLTERLGLAGEFSGPLPANIDSFLKSLALRLETDPARREILQGRPAKRERTHSFSPGFQLWSNYLQAPDHHSKTPLSSMAYEGLLRLLKVFGGLLTLLTFGVLAALFGKASPPVNLQPGKSSLKLVIAVFCAWIILPHLLLRLHSLLWPTLDPFARLMLAQTWSYLVAGLLLASFWRWKDWKPWKSVDWELTGKCYLALLASLPLAEVLMHRTTGFAPEVILSLAPVFQGRSLAEGALLSVIAVFLGPLVEELMFRGWLLFGLAQHCKKGVALFLSSLLFALCHVNFWGFPILFAFALLSGSLALRTGSFASSLALHILWNATTLCLVAAVI